MTHLDGIDGHVISLGGKNRVLSIDFYKAFPETRAELYKDDLSASGQPSSCQLPRFQASLEFHFSVYFVKPRI